MEEMLLFNKLNWYYKIGIKKSIVHQVELQDLI